jgi:hypothetical protein
MPEENRTSQAVTFVIAAALGVGVMLFLAHSCRKMKVEETVDSIMAPAPDTIASRKAKAANGTPRKDAASKPPKPSGSASADFAAQANALAKRPLEEISDQLDELMAQWASEDPAGAAAWVKQLTPGDIREAAAVSLCQTWAGINPQAAAAWVAENSGKGMLQGALGAVSSVWAHADPAATATWIAGLSESTDRTVGEVALAQAWGEINPAAASEWMKTLSPESQGNVVQSLVIGMAASDPAAAAAWLQGAMKENSKIPMETAGVVVGSWVASDAGAVSRWLNALPEGPFYEAAATAFAQAAAEKSPADALVWARSLANAENRELAVVNAMELWIDNDRKGFVEALPKQLEATSDPALRKAIYDMLYRKDPAFKDSLLNLAETPDTPAPSSR